MKIFEQKTGRKMLVNLTTVVLFLKKLNLVGPETKIACKKINVSQTDTRTL